jgi:glycosyltransferase involved in cell wall biosynthesis
MTGYQPVVVTNDDRSTKRPSIWVITDMRVLIAHSFYRIPGGEDRYVSEQTQLLRERHAVEVVAAENDDLSSSPRTASNMLLSRKSTDRMAARIAAFGPDVVHLHNPYPSFGPAVHLAAEKLGLPVVQTIHNVRLRCPNGLMFTQGAVCTRCQPGNYIHSILHECFPSRSQAAAYAASLWTHRFVLRLENRVTRFVAPSLFMKDRLLSWGVAPDRVSMVRNFVNDRESSEVPTNGPGVYIGRLSPEKGLDVLISALHRAGDPPFKVIGDGPIREDLERQVTNHGLRRISLLGRLNTDDVARSLDEAGYLVMPSVCYENAPLAVLEAMAAGRPVVVSDRGGLPELVGEGGGVTFRAGDASSLASAIQQLADGSSLRARLGRAAHEFAQSQLSATAHLRALESVYSLAAQPPTPEPRPSR